MLPVLGLATAACSLGPYHVTAYTLAQRSRGRISPSTLYRLVRGLIPYPRL